MPGWTNYKGLEVPADTPSGDAGLALKDNFIALADRAPQSNFSATVNPTGEDDDTEGYEIGSVWVNTTSKQVFVCVDNTTDEAEWIPVGPDAIEAGAGLSYSEGVMSLDVANSNTWSSQQIFVAPNASTVPLIVKEASGQTANAFEMQSSDGTLRSWLTTQTSGVNNYGTLYLRASDAGSIQTAGDIIFRSYIWDTVRIRGRLFGSSGTPINSGLVFSTMYQGSIRDGFTIQGAGSRMRVFVGQTNGTVNGYLEAYNSEGGVYQPGLILCNGASPTGSDTGIDFHQVNDSGTVARIRRVRNESSLNNNVRAALQFETKDGTTLAGRMRISECGNVGLGILQRLSALTVKPYPDATLRGNTTANSSTTITGSGTFFLDDIGIGDRIALSSSSSVYASVTAIASNTSLTVDSPLGDGSTQTITLKKSIARFTDSAGSTKLLVNDSGSMAFDATKATARLQLPAGTASIASLKLTTGTNLSAAQSGAVEWDGDRLYITQDSGPTRKTIAYTDELFDGDYNSLDNLPDLSGFITADYTPANPGHWGGSPTTIAEALDRIAAVVSNGGSTPIP